MVHQPIPEGDLQQMRTTFETALARLSGARRQDVARRLERLYALLQEGRLDQQTQGQLLEVAHGVSAGNKAEVSRVCTQLTAQHWEQHQDWILGLRRLAFAA